MPEYIAGQQCPGCPGRPGFTDQDFRGQGQQGCASAQSRQERLSPAVRAREKLEELARDLNHQGVIAEIAAWRYWELDELVQGLDISANPVLLMLAGVEDPHNLGALLRSGECAGVAGVILPKRRSAQLTGTVARVSMGAIESVPVCRVGNLAQTLEILKDKGFWVAAADMDGENYWGVDWNFPVVLILGSEGKGVPRLLREKSDYTVSIPTLGRVNSLNVSVAGAVILYEILRQRY